MAAFILELLGCRVFLAITSSAKQSWNQLNSFMMTRNRNEPPWVPKEILRLSRNSAPINIIFYFIMPAESPAEMDILPSLPHKKTMSAHQTHFKLTESSGSRFQRDQGNESGESNRYRLICKSVFIVWILNITSDFISNASIIMQLILVTDSILQMGNISTSRIKHRNVNPDRHLNRKRVDIITEPHWIAGSILQCHDSLWIPLYLARSVWADRHTIVEHAQVPVAMIRLRNHFSLPSLPYWSHLWG